MTVQRLIGLDIPPVGYGLASLEPHCTHTTVSLDGGEIELGTLISHAPSKSIMVVIETHVDYDRKLQTLWLGPAKFEEA